MVNLDNCPECGEWSAEFISRDHISPLEVVEEYGCYECDTQWNIIYEVKEIRWEDRNGDIVSERMKENI